MNYTAVLGFQMIRTRIRCCKNTEGSRKLLKRFSSTTTTSNDSTPITGSADTTLLLLQQVKDGTLTIENAVAELSQLHSVSVDRTSVSSLTSTFANIDHDRYARTNFPEVIFAQNKTPYQVVNILDEMADRQIQKLYSETQMASPKPVQKQYLPPILATRVIPEMFEEINTLYKFQHGSIAYYPIARIIRMNANIPISLQTNSNGTTKKFNKRVVVATAGTTDIAIAEEAAVILEASDVDVDRIYDVGVAGLYRIINALPKLTDPNVGCIIVCAGMDGALPSVVGGLVQVPVIAVPTSIGYGASFHGVSALLTMLNSCAPGVGVVNIDNGFGAAALAYKSIQ